LSDLASGSGLGGRGEELRGRSVLIATEDQLAAALALIELDGVAHRLVVCPPDLRGQDLGSIMAIASADAIVSDRELAQAGASSTSVVRCGARIEPSDRRRPASGPTEWVLLTSGTTGLPKLVLHSLSSLTGAIRRSDAAERPAVVWSTFYDIRRYGGLQIFLRAVVGGGSLVLSSATEPIGDFLKRAGSHGVTHISGTPSHWRRALMSPFARSIAPVYVRLSGEIADQAILDHLRVTYPGARVAHAFASTEAGVAFEVGDGLAGFPAGLIGRSGTDVEMKIEDGSLRIRSPRTAMRYVGGQEAAIRDEDGFVDTGDIVELRDGRYYFVGRRGGIINVGGLKVHPEEVEAVINRLPGVRMSLVKPRKNMITGAVVVADVVATSEVESSGAVASGALSRDILNACRSALAPYKVPAAIRFVPSLDVAASGKLVRPNA
jgi:acyl-coenzyme A synthetase/AMP-(fatty) acid ligase